MKISRRTLITGGAVGATSVGVVGFFRGWFDRYESDVRVENRRPTSTAVEFVLSNLDENRTVLDESFTLAPDEDFHREGVLSDETRYRVTVRTDGDSTEKEFETCCRGYRIGVRVERDRIQVLPTHYD